MKIMRKKDLGFGCMRMPLIDPEDITSFDFNRIEQLQINYLDWEQPNAQSRRCLEIANKYHKPVTVLEPCKGGMMAKVPREVEKLMKSRRPDWMPAIGQCVQPQCILFQFGGGAWEVQRLYYVRPV